MHWPFKGIILAEPKGSLKIRQPQIFLRQPLKWLSFLCLGVLATRKRVYVFLKTQLVTHYVLLQLVLYIFSDRFLVSTDSIYIIPSAPKMPVPIPIL